MPISFIDQQITLSELAKVARERFGDLVKAVVDVEKKVMCIGAELHSDEEAQLLEMGSKQQDLWGINIYPDKSGEERIEFDSMINIRPSQGNYSRGVNDSDIRRKILQYIADTIQDS